MAFKKSFNVVSSIVLALALVLVPVTGPMAYAKTTSNQLDIVKGETRQNDSSVLNMYAAQGKSISNAVYQTNGIMNNSVYTYMNDQTNDQNLFPQPRSNEGFAAKGYGTVNANSYHVYKYDYAQNVPWSWHGFNIGVSPDQNYTFSFDAYISPDANIPNTGTTFIANSEQGFQCAFFYDNSKKGTWQHFEYTGKPTSGIAAALLYPTTGQISATTGYILYKNIEFKKNGTATNLFPQPGDNSEFQLKGNGIMAKDPSYSDTYCMYRYDYSQNMPWSWHGFSIGVSSDQNYTFSFDAYISPDANISSTGTTLVATGEQGFQYAFFYDNSKKGTWQHFEYTAKPTSGIAYTLLYPTTGQIPATTGYILYKNVEFKQAGKINNLFPQPIQNNGFQVKNGGAFQSSPYQMYSYEYSQNVTWSWHGFGINVNPNLYYTYSFDAYISPDANIPNTGTTFIANGEQGFGYTFFYDNSKKGTWQHFEYTAKPTSDLAYALLYPTTGQIPATTGYILYRNVEFRVNGTEWFSNNATYQYNPNNQLIETRQMGSPRIKFYYDNNGNLIRKQKL